MDADSFVMGKQSAPTGRYANTLSVGYNAFEFIFDFTQAYAEEACPCSCTRIVTSPVYAKGMIMALMTALEAFERDFGRIGSDRVDATDESRPNSE